MFRPTCYLTFTLEGEDLTSAKASEVKRSYSYVAPTRVAAGRKALGGTGGTDNGEEPALANSIKLDVRASGFSWDADGAGALDGAVARGSATSAPTWERDVLPWLRLKVDKIASTVRECNNPARRSFAGKTAYARLTVTLDGRRTDVELDEDGTPLDLDAALARLAG